MPHPPKNLLDPVNHGGKRRYRCPECGTRNVRLLATGTFLVDISNTYTWSGHFNNHNLDALGHGISHAWSIKPSAFICEECNHESRSWHRNADALKTAVEWSEVME